MIIEYSINPGECELCGAGETHLARCRECRSKWFCWYCAEDEERDHECK